MSRSVVLIVVLAWPRVFLSAAAAPQEWQATEPAVASSHSDAQVDSSSEAPQTAVAALQETAPPQTPPPESPEQIVRPEETKHTPSTAHRIITNFWYDQKAIWTSPMRINRENAKWWAMFGAGTAALIATDHRTSTALPNTVTQMKYSRDVSQIGAAYTALPVAGALYLYGRAINNPKARETGVLGAEALLDSYIAVSILKVAAGRERPLAGDGRGRFFVGETGFPSGHSIMSWSFASLISHEYTGGKVVPVVAYSLATLVSVSRFTARKHFASDILAGGAMGWFIGRHVFESHLDPSIHKRYDPNASNHFMPQIAPLFQPETRGYGLSVSWNP